MKNEIASHISCRNNWWYCDQQLKYDGTVYSLAFNHKNENELAIGIDSSITVINTQTYTTLLPKTITTNNTPLSLAYSNDDTLLAYGTYNHITLVSTENRQEQLIDMPNDTIWAVTFDNNSKHLIAGSLDAVTIINIKNEENIRRYLINDHIYGTYWHDNTIMCSAFKNNLHTINIVTNEIKTIKISNLRDLWASAQSNNSWAFGYKNGTAFVNKDLIFCSSDEDNAIYSLAFNNNGQQFAIGLLDGDLFIYNNYAPTTLEQTLLRHIFLLWLQVEKPDKCIKNPDALLRNISKKFCLYSQELTSGWKTLPPNIQALLWERMNHLIQTYGK